MANITNIQIGSTSCNILSTSIGGIIQTSLPIFDDHFHLADGTYVSGGIYDYLVHCEEEYPNIFTCTNDMYETCLSTYNQCGKYVLDTENQRVRLPLLTGFLESTADVNSASTLKEAGLPDIDGRTGYTVTANDDTTNGFFRKEFTSQYGVSSAGTNTNIKFVHLIAKASWANSIYGKSTKVQPQSVLVLTYIRIN